MEHANFKDIPRLRRAQLIILPMHYQSQNPLQCLLSYDYMRQCQKYVKIQRPFLLDQEVMFHLEMRLMNQVQAAEMTNLTQKSEPPESARVSAYP